MLRSKAITGLIRPMRQLGISRVPISSYSKTTMRRDHIPTPANEIYDHFNGISRVPKPISSCSKTKMIRDHIPTRVNEIYDHFNGVSRVPKPISSCSQTTMIRDHIPTPANENQIQDHFNKQSMTQCIEKDAEGTRKLQKTHKVKKDKICVLVSTLLDLEDSKEAVYGGLDAWVVGEQEFPIGRLKTALITLEKKQQWHKVVQVIKWMLSKGQGVTVGTYGQLIRALDMDHRVVEANKLWVKKLGRDVQSVPWKVCDIMISVYYRNEMWVELVKLFKSLEGHGRKPPDQSIVQKVAESYEKLGLVEENERILEKYKSLFIKTRGKYGRKPSKESSKSAIAKISS